MSINYNEPGWIICIENYLYVNDNYVIKDVDEVINCLFNTLR